MILFTSTYLEPDERRMRELLYCLEKNIANPVIESIQLAFESFTYEDEFSRMDRVSPKHFELIRHPKVRLTKNAARMKFNDWFEMANLISNPALSPVIIANSDIYFDETLRLLDREYLQKRFVCLSRRHATFDQVGVPDVDLQAPCAQDAWAFMPPLSYKHGEFNFTTGCRGCDNRVAAEMEASGYQVINPCLSVHAFHVHASKVVHYGKNVPGPHMNVNPRRI